jgi:hypothetical protein
VYLVRGHRRGLWRFDGRATRRLFSLRLESRAVLEMEARTALWVN